MIGDSENKEVRYDKYCESCKYWADGKEIPDCDDCLEESMRMGTEVPVKWEKK
jgi:hypothetical protein